MWALAGFRVLGVGWLGWKFEIRSLRIQEGNESMYDKGVEMNLCHTLPRLEYDAYRTDLEELSLGPRDAGTRGRLESAQATFQAHRDKYEKLRGDVAIKLKFLEENKVPTPPPLAPPSYL